MTKLFNKLPTWLLALMFLIGISLATALLTFMLIAVPTKILLPAMFLVFAYACIFFAIKELRD